MKKAVSLALSCTVALGAMSTLAFANEKDILIEADGVMPINLEVAEYAAETTVLRGTLSVSDEGVLLTGENGVQYALNTDSTTTAFIGTAYGSFADMKAELNGKEVAAAVSTAMTRSIPAQTFAYSILAADETANPIYVEIARVEMDTDAVRAYSADGNYVVNVAPQTIVKPIQTKNIVAALELKAGDRIAVYSSMMTMSIPAQLNPDSIILLHSAEGSSEVDPAVYLQEHGYLHGTENGLELERTATQAEALAMAYRVMGKETPAAGEGHWADALIADAKTNGFIVSDMQTTTTLYGTLNITEDGVMLTDEGGISYQLNVDGNTLGFAGTENASFDEMKDALNGKAVYAAVSNAMTRSIPAQTYAYAVFATEAEACPIYMEISDVQTDENGIITVYSADGQYAAAMTNETAVKPVKTKNIVRASDLKAGDKIAVYSDIMTMSIPAVLNPSQVLVLEQATVFEADAEIETEAFLNLIKSMNPEADVTGFAAEGLLTRANMASICYALLK